jgi:hypothetical protein
MAACGPTPTPVLSERLVVQIDFSSWIQESFTVSPDSQRVAYVAQLGDKQLVVVDGKEEEPYDGIGTLIFSLDSQRVAYGAQVGDKWFVVVDGKEEKPYDGIVRGGSIIFDSADSLHYLALKGADIYLVEERIQ